MIAGTLVLLGLLAVYAACIGAWLDWMVVVMLALPHLPVLIGKRSDPLGTLMFAVYAAVESGLLAVIAWLLLWPWHSCPWSECVIALALLANTLREVYRYVTIDHFPGRLAKVATALLCAAYMLAWLG